RGGARRGGGGGGGRVGAGPGGGARGPAGGGRGEDPRHALPSTGFESRAGERLVEVPAARRRREQEVGPERAQLARELVADVARDVHQRRGDRGADRHGQGGERRAVAPPPQRRPQELPFDP